MIHQFTPVRLWFIILSLALALWPIQAGAQLRSPTIDDLVTLQEIRAPLLSPDGSFVTYVVTEAVLERNDYSVGVFLARADGSGSPVRLAEYGIRDDADAVSPGSEESPTAERALDAQRARSRLNVRAYAAWSASSRMLAYIKQGRQGWEIWVRDVSTNRDQALAAGLANVALTGWNLAEDGVLFTTQVDPVPAPDQDVRVPDHALFYDGSRDAFTDRPWANTAQSAREDVNWTVSLLHNAVVRRDTGSSGQSATPPALRFEYPRTRPLWNQSAGRHQLSPDGQFVAFRTRFVIPETASRPPVYRGEAISIIPAHGGEEPRHLYRSDYIPAEPIGWASDSRTVYFLERTLEYSAIYSAAHDGSRVRHLYRTNQYLTGLSWNPDRNLLAAVAEQPNVPPRLVVIDLLRRRERVIHVPNPHLDDVDFPSSYLIRERNRYGHEMAVRVTLPNGYTRGRRYPLVATSYVSPNHFQRGAAGDEFPIFAFTSAGFVVVSLEDSPDLLAPSELGNLAVSNIRVLSPLATLESAIRRLIDEGVVDEERCGITGMSFGGEIVNYAMLNSDLFRVAATSTVGMDPLGYLLMRRVWRDGSMRLRGLPFPDAEGIQTWRTISVALNADRVRTPLLLQPSDWEATPLVMLHQALQRAGVPVEMYVYPNEGHVKHAPRSRYWVYRRNVAWMRFWLQDYEDSDPETAGQYRRWRLMRDDWRRRRAL